MGIFSLELAETSPVRAFSAFAEEPYALLFDSADPNHPASRYAYIAARPVEAIEAEGRELTLTTATGSTQRTGDPIAILQERLDHYRITGESLPGLPPFQGGAAGFFGYDLGRCYETLPKTSTAEPGVPDMAIGIYDQVIAFDTREDKAWIIVHAGDEHEAKIKQRHLLKILERAQEPAPAAPVTLDWEANFEPDEYIRAVERIIEYIRAGDIFQANMTQRFDAALPLGFNAFAHYLRLRKVNPAPFAGFMNFGNLKIASASPERFLTVTGRDVETCPIKGTAPRDGDPALDRHYRDRLSASEKDRAENTMIVDLLRNDLSRVCTPESVKVKSLCALESFASVHHLVSTVTGTLQEGRAATDLLRACFPGGSITGAPKIRAMEIIEALEPTRRGPYCGAMGYIGFDGSMDTNILIRTLVFKNGGVSFQAGGGITAASDPDAEYQESFDKADAMFRSFEDPEYEVDAEFMAMAGIA